MKQIKAHIAVSLDGHTATLDKELDWLSNEVKAIIGKYYLDADCLLMGANTYGGLGLCRTRLMQIACLWGRTPTTTSLNTGAGGRTKASGLLWCHTTTPT